MQIYSFADVTERYEPEAEIYFACYILTNVSLWVFSIPLHIIRSRLRIRSGTY